MAIKKVKFGITPKGDFDANREGGYEDLDAVYDADSNSSYMSRKDANTDPVTNKDAWQKMVDGSVVKKIVDEYNRAGFEEVNVTLTSTVAGDDLTGKVVSVYSTTNTLLSQQPWAGEALTFQVPTGTDYYVQAEAMADYKQPKSGNYRAVKGNQRAVAIQYQAEVVTLSVHTDDNNEDVANRQVTIKIGSTSKTYSVADAPKTFKVPYGTSYTVSVNAFPYYYQPASQTYTASQAARTVEIVYNTNSAVVSILRTDGQLVKAENWSVDDNDKVVGIVLVNSNVSLVLGKELGKFPWGGSGNFSAGVTTTTDTYDGENNTNLLVAETGHPAAQAAHDYVWLDTGTTGGWLPSYAELDAFVKLNSTAVQKAMGACGFGTFGSMWSSTQSSADNAWCWLGWFWYGDLSKSLSAAVRAVRRFEP